jgi:hypothetical protein
MQTRSDIVLQLIHTLPLQTCVLACLILAHVCGFAMFLGLIGPLCVKPCARPVLLFLLLVQVALDRDAEERARKFKTSFLQGKYVMPAKRPFCGTKTLVYNNFGNSCLFAWADWT